MSDINEVPVDEQLPVIVMIGEPIPNQRHIGILHRESDASPKFLHLAWHCILQNESDIPDYMRLWTTPSVEPVRLRLVAALCRLVWRKNESDGIPYAFSSPANTIDATSGAVLLGPSRFGLTCATFVLALFDAVGIRIAQYATWPQDRQGDIEWQTQIIASLLSRAAPEHIEHLQSEVGAARFRPEEVAASAAIAPPAAEFEAASVLAAR